MLLPQPGQRLRKHLQAGRDRERTELCPAIERDSAAGVSERAACAVVGVLVWVGSPPPALLRRPRPGGTAAATT